MNQFKGTHTIDMLLVRNISRSTWIQLTHGGRDTMLTCDVLRSSNGSDVCSVRVVANGHDAVLDDVSTAAVRCRSVFTRDTLPAPPEEPAGAPQPAVLSQSDLRSPGDV